MSAHASQSTCNALIRRSIDLRQLYGQAAAACEPGLRVVLSENAHTLEMMIADLQAQLSARGSTPCTHGSSSALLRRRLTGCLIRTVARPDNAWIRALMHHESALLRAFERAIEGTSVEAAPALRRQLPRLRGIHLDMHHLAGSARY